MAIAQEIIDRVLGAADIVGIIGEHVKLSKRSGQYWGVCPFHNEKTTSSFTVSPTKGIYKCFGCGKGGNVINFLQEHEKMSFPEAVRYLGKRYNIEIPERSSPRKNYNERKKRITTSRFTSRRTPVRPESFFEGSERILDKRGFSPDDPVIERYQIGYAQAHRATSDALKKQGFPWRDAIRYIHRGKKRERHVLRLFSRPDRVSLFQYYREHHRFPSSLPSTEG